MSARDQLREAIASGELAPVTAAAPETPATPGQAAYEAYLAHLQGADPGYGQWVKPFAAIDKHDRDAWEAAAIAARQPQPAPGNGERPAVYARFLRASYPALPDHQVADAWRSADAREVAFWRDVEAKVIPAECRTPGCCNDEEASR